MTDGCASLRPAAQRCFAVAQVQKSVEPASQQACSSTIRAAQLSRQCLSLPCSTSPELSLALFRLDICTSRGSCDSNISAGPGFYHDEVGSPPQGGAFGSGIAALSFQAHALYHILPVDLRRRYSCYPEGVMMIGSHRLLGSLDGILIKATFPHLVSRGTSSLIAD